MALVKCPECGKENVSDSAHACPECGFDVSNYYKEKRNTDPYAKANELALNIKKYSTEELAEIIQNQEQLYSAPEIRVAQTEYNIRTKGTAAKKSGFTPTLGHIILMIVLIVIGLGAVAGMSKGGSSSSGKDASEDMYRECYYFSQYLVKEQLKSPKSASFPSYDESFISQSGDVVKVTAYVDAENSFGASIRTKYVATIYVSDNKPDKGSVVLVE